MRELLVEELIKIGVKENKATIIALDFGSSQCIVNKEYLIGINIETKILEKVHQKVIDFYCGEIDGD